MSQSKILTPIHQRSQSYVQFDPMNAEHMRAYVMLSNGRQHPSLRFELEFPYQDVYAMMHVKIGKAHAQHIIGQAELANAA